MSSVAKMIATIEEKMDAESETPLTAANLEHLRMVEALLFAVAVNVANVARVIRMAKRQLRVNNTLHQFQHRMNQPAAAIAHPRHQHLLHALLL